MWKKLPEVECEKWWSEHFEVIQPRVLIEETPLSIDRHATDEEERSLNASLQKKKPKER